MVKINNIELPENIGNWSLDLEWAGGNILYRNKKTIGLQLWINEIHGGGETQFSVHVYRHRINFRNRFEKRFPSFRGALEYAIKYMRMHPNG